MPTNLQKIIIRKNLFLKIIIIMRNTFFFATGLIFIFLFSAFCSFAQTKRIAFRSHSGKAKEFSIREEGNFGEIAPYYNYPKPKKKVQQPDRKKKLRQIVWRMQKLLQKPSPNRIVWCLRRMKQ